MEDRLWDDCIVGQCPWTGVVMLGLEVESPSRRWMGRCESHLEEEDVCTPVRAIAV